MAKILFVSEATNTELSAAKKMIADAFDCTHCAFNAEEILHKTQTGEIKLVFAFLRDISAASKKEFSYVLTHEKEVPFILCGSREEIHPFFGTSDARIIKSFLTPVKAADIILGLKNLIKRIEGGEELELTASDSISEKEKLEVENTKKRILLVDDDIVSLRMIMNWINDEYQVAVAKSGPQAMAYLGKEIPDLILLDYEMPVMDGVQTFSAIRSEAAYANIPVIFLTGMDDQMHVLTALKYKPDGYILKSAGVKSLKEKMKEVLNR